MNRSTFRNWRKPERPHDVIRESSLIVRLTYPYADTWIKWLAEQIFSLKRDLPYKKVTKVADFQSGKAKTSTRTTKSAVFFFFFFLMFHWLLLYKIHLLIPIISVQLERKRENREPLWTALATFVCFKFGARSELKFSDISRVILGAVTNQSLSTEQMFGGF